MNIVQLSTGHLGGAGLAARRLNAGLRASGVESSFFALDHPSYVREEGEYEIKRNVSQRVKSGLSTLASSSLSGGSLVTPFSTNIVNRDFFLAFKKNKNTIFHIHNWFNIFSQAKIAELSNEFNLVLTLHDQRLFTSACHYSLGCEKFTTYCHHCPQLPKRFDAMPSQIKGVEMDFSQLSFITPSNWLMTLARSSRLLSRSSGSVIPNSFFGYQGRVNAKRMTDSKIQIGFAAMDPASWIKGGDIISSFIQETSCMGRYEFLTLSSFERHLDFWSSIDVLMVPSRADNSPNVIHEAKLWGIPVISSNVGGILEIIDKDFDCALSPEEFTIDRLESEISRVVKNSKSESLRKSVAARHYAYLDTSIGKHVSLYESLQM